VTNKGIFDALDNAAKILADRLEKIFGCICKPVDSGDPSPDDQDEDVIKASLDDDPKWNWEISEPDELSEEGL